MSSNPLPYSLPNLAGKVFVVTGGNAGIGKETVIGLASHNARVYMGARSEQRAVDAIADIKRSIPNADVQYLPLDLSNLVSVSNAAQTLLKNESALHGLVNNAGIMGVPYLETKDGYEVQFQTNYLAHFLLTKLLSPLLLSTADSSGLGDVRIVNVTSDGHQLFENNGGICFDDIQLQAASSMKRYAQSKLANILHIKELNRTFGPESQSDNAKIWVAAKATGVAPAYVLRTIRLATRLLKVLDNPDKGAFSTLWAIASKEFDESMSGAYIIPYMKIGTPSKYAMDEVLASRLWSWTTDQLKQRGFLG
ncbi:NAD(P)-binding protein [Trichoderma asperelloides]|nr:NAD(P)-binding protein [Trichoderma asperelloides]